MRIVPALALVLASALQPAMAADTPAIVFVPGYMSSELRINGQVVWYPPQASQLATDFTRLAVAGGPASPSDGAVATKVLAPSDTLPNGLAAKYDLVAFAYDWRNGVTGAAGQLERFLASDPLTRSGRPVVLVAHSMGGLVVQALAARNGPTEINRIITIGTPHLGAPSIVINGFRGMILGPGAVLDANAMQRNQPTWPSFYDMLPAYPGAGGMACCFRETGSGVQPLDLFMPAGFAQLNWPSAQPSPPNVVRQLAESVANRAAIAAARTDRLFAIAGLSTLPGQDEARTTPLSFTLSSSGSMDVGHQDACAKTSVTCSGGDLVVPQYSATYGQARSGTGQHGGTCTVRLGSGAYGPYSHGDMLMAPVVHTAAIAAISAVDNRAAWCPAS